ncbi:hypothetical protein GBO14_18270 [Pseudoalteromonas shioyasakiensis]|uniref:hypothetical protein n=1 Tax=Pseudoalteromonas shioyasakiensis TaxID=1190813 RepID=UPI002094E461|nr:hypothetical protein [Pseudoalteromonas shioyasakiensis]MCO6356669.1 hypothetical protein [Pseudoalteromonas shioyasakiensis]
MALVFVLMICAILAVLMNITIISYQNSLKMSSIINKRADTEAMLLSAKTNVVTELMSSEVNVLGLNQSTISEVTSFDNFQGVPFIYKETMEVSITDLSGLISISPLNKGALYKLFSSKGMDEQQWLALIDRFDDWEDEDSLTRIQGKELGDYKGRKALPMNLSIQSTSDIYYLLDDDFKSNFSQFSGWLTVYGSPESVRSKMPKQLQAQVYDTGEESGIVSDYFASTQEAIEETDYPSGQFLVSVAARDESITIKLKFKIIRGLGTFQPFYVIDETYE